MKKHLLFIAIIVTICYHSIAQITLTQSNTMFTVGSMTAVEADTTAFILPVQGTNMLWNYSNLLQKSSSNLNYVTPANPNFAAATFADTGGSAQIIPNQYFIMDTYYQTSSVGTKSLGFAVKKQPYPIGSLTGNNADSIVFPDQFFTYASNSYLMPFPASMSTSWKTTTRSLTNFNLTVTNYAINKAPCQKVTNTVRLDTVVGWGKLRVPTASGPSYAYDVLMIKRNVIQKDSFYMSGQPASAVLLTAFGITQDQTTITNRYMFWRANARYTLLLLNFGSNNFTKISSVFYDGSAQFDPSGINENNLNTELNIYPNPNKGVFSIQNDFLNESFEMNIYNILGKLVYSKKYDASNAEFVEVEAGFLKQGNYFVNLTSLTKRISSKLLIQ